MRERAWSWALAPLVATLVATIAVTAYGFSRPAKGNDVVYQALGKCVATDSTGTQVEFYPRMPLDTFPALSEVQMLGYIEVRRNGTYALTCGGKYTDGWVKLPKRYPLPL